ncbi:MULTISPECIES: DEAD/DEAH box helicase [unclassified Colwellia]|uniref:DEAD/DEAH box helicase n=1 Tax=unclassified Colwellia TaxID=196834 RepID=UPI0015F75B7E|nr:MULTISPECIES: DEAD/DEAH box helicase [unclassified Colwellia]MBA6233730.1 DEAD/DEAH box helicase [Colwellia sp. MB02u-7]MBA6237889.1 DEAD/DEAH box helicase [Colwellia sp. MB02u-11]MBA6300454.1 DEAD/DEAH box helicase [Colwellia sp. MB3u-22]MBA6302791.1 DEAD/DEAH box helicase [Colwellia sp. MB02u-14]MBA6311045.1 DEAD/DEAH box helicase [Colwellia sp. MB3u-64]
MSEFKEFSLLESIIDRVTLKGYKEPTPIQKECIPALIDGNDLLGIAQTGTGKTAAFSLPIINNFGRNKIEIEAKSTRSLILTPTRELASQIMQNIDDYSDGLGLKTKVVYGGVGRQNQVDSIALGLDILVATPGRLLDLIETGDINFKALEVFVLDEADTMLDMGFFKDVQTIIAKLPKNRQTLLFSATMPAEIEILATAILTSPIKIQITAETVTIDLVNQSIYHLEKANKVPLLFNLLKNPDYKKVLIFCKTKYGADIIVKALEKASITAASLHSSKTQVVREEALQNFKDSNLRVLVATDVAARGIDVDNINLVINYNLPEDPRNYIHRIGRTARAGKSGMAISFAVENDIRQLINIENSIGQVIPVVTEQPFHKEFSKAPKQVKKKVSKANKTNRTRKKSK